MVFARYRTFASFAGAWLAAVLGIAVGGGAYASVEHDADLLQGILKLEIVSQCAAQR